MRTKGSNYSDDCIAKARTLFNFLVALSLAALPLLLGVASPAIAQGNGLTADVNNLGSAVDLEDAAGGDFIIVCPTVGGTLDGKCGAGEDDPLFVAFGNAGDRRILVDGKTLEGPKTVSGHAFGSLLGTSAGDVISWSFERTRPKKFESQDLRVSVRVLDDDGSLTSPDACGVGRKPKEMVIQQDADLSVSVCNLAAEEFGLDLGTIAWVFAADTSRLAQQQSATVTTCTGFIAQCVDPENLALNGVDIESTRVIDAYDGTYGSRRLW